jgi:hypothetical protein
MNIHVHVLKISICSVMAEKEDSHSDDVSFSLKGARSAGRLIFKEKSTHFIDKKTI